MALWQLNSALITAQEVTGLNQSRSQNQHMLGFFINLPRTPLFLAFLEL
jgi:hypothetical protein